MRRSLDAEQTSTTTNGPQSVRNGTKAARRTAPKQSSAAGRLRAVVMTACLVAVFFQEGMAATTDVYALEKLRVAELKQILKSRGLSCDGCTEKRAYVDMVVESSHLDRRSSSHRTRARNPNDWDLPRDDFRIDLWATLVPAISYICMPILGLVRAYPLVAGAALLALGVWGLRVAHRCGKHNDIPFKQYLRFQARLQYKHALRAGKWMWVQIFSIHMVSMWAWRWLVQRSWTQVGYTAAVLSLWAMFSYIGFGAVFVLIMGFATVFMNLGERKAGQASAYTVFNNFQPLEGELRMEQIEAEMRHMPMPRQNVHVNREVLASAQESDAAVVKAGRNDKVEVESKDGLRRHVKVKTLQQYLDQGYTQVEAVRYEGITYQMADTD